MQRDTLQLRKKKVRIIVRELKKLFPDAKMVLRYSNNWELLVAVILSAQCTDKKVNEVTERLFKKYKTLDDYANADARAFEQDIKSTGFFRNKAKNILAAAKVLKATHGGKMPKTMQEMIAFPGVGRKTANVVLGNAYGIVEGIAVDTHVRRLSRFFGLTDEHDPKKIELDLIQILPRDEWFDFTYRMIEYGRRYQSARKKDVQDLPLTRALMKFVSAPYHGIVIGQAFLDSKYANTF